MKAKNYLLLGMMAVSMAFVSCEEALSESCDSENFKDDFNCSFDAIATFCSDGTNNAYYTYDGKKYECTGAESSTCDEAIAKIGEDLVANGCGTKKSGVIEAKLSAMAEQLLLEVRTNSLQN